METSISQKVSIGSNVQASNIVPTSDEETVNFAIVVMRVPSFADTLGTISNRSISGGEILYSRR